MPYGSHEPHGLPPEYRTEIEPGLERIYPDCTRFVQLKSPVAKRLADLRLHQSALRFCNKAMEEFTQETSLSAAIREAMLIGIAAKFFSCFGRNVSSGSLNSSKVFSNNQELNSWFSHWKDVRDNHLIHNSSQMTHLSTGLAIDTESNVLEVVSIMVVADINKQENYPAALSVLINVALAHVDYEIEKSVKKLRLDAEAMTAESRNVLPRIEFRGPGAIHAAKTSRSKPV